MKVVLDTNVLVSALSSRSVYHWLVTELFNERFEVYITDEVNFPKVSVVTILEFEKIIVK